MPLCDISDNCPFYNNKLPNGPNTAKNMIDQYCHASYTTCARYLVSIAIGINKVPDDLFPHMFEEAEKILINHKLI